MLLRSLIVVGFVGVITLSADVSSADELASHVSVSAITGVNFEDARGARSLSPSSELDSSPIELSWRETGAQRFAEFRADPVRDAERERRAYELSFSASGAQVGLPVDVAIAQRASIGESADGRLDRAGSGSELRLGRGVSLNRWEAPSWDDPAWYMFVASEDEAVTWRPGARNAFGGAGSSFSLQDRVEIGDMQAGVTFEAGGLRASLAYVERQIQSRSGSQTFTQDENFAGLTITMRR